jgi:hypothetical protein
MKCGATGKTIFKSPQSANERSNEIISESSNRRSTPKYFNVYQCEFCGFYHITGKQSRKEFDNAG